MSSIARLCICVVLVGNVVSLSTNFMQSDALSNEEGFEQEVKPQLPLAVLPANKNTSREDVQSLRGAANMSVDSMKSYFMSSIESGPMALESRVQADVVMSALSRVTTGRSVTRMLAVTFMSILIFLAIFIIFSIMEEGSDDEMPAKPKEDMKAMEVCDGTWARTYQCADGKGKEGLELLFRCHIIPTEEFAHSVVSQEHIDECVWIASNMLFQRPLEEWTEVWPEALRTFEESVTACFAARKDVRTSLFDETLPEGSQQGSPRALQYLKRHGNLPPGSGASDKDSMEQSAGARGSSPNPSKTSASKPEISPILSNEKQRKSLMDRCRQIMSASDAGKKPWEGKAKAKSAAAKSGATGSSPENVGSDLSPPRSPDQLQLGKNMSSKP